MTRDTYNDPLQTLIATPKATLDRIWKTALPGDTAALYLFYCYTAKWQETDKPRATTGFCAKGLGWTENRVRKAKKELKTLGLIEDKQEQNSDGKMGKCYIHITYISHRPHDYRSPANRPSGKQQTNALGTITNTISKEIEGKPISLESEELISFEKILRETVISTGGFKTRFTPNSKVIKNTYQYLREIKDNTFLHRPLEAKPLEGMDTHRINTTMDNRRLRAVLLKASRNWAKACDSPDIFTPDKKPSLDAWFYTGPPNSKGMSWFLYCATDNMKENYNQEQRGMVEGLKKYIDKFEPGAHKLRDKLYNKSDTKYWGDREWITFYSTVKALMVWRLESKESLKAKNDSWAILFGSLGKTFDTIRHFLDDMYGGKAYPKFLEPKGTNWNKFRQWLNAGWDFDL